MGSALLTVATARAAAQHPPKANTVYVESVRAPGFTDGQALAAAFAAAGNGTRIKLDPGRTYALTSTLIANLTTKRDVFLDGQGARIDGTAVSGAILRITGGSGSVSTTLTAPVTARTYSLTVASTSGILAGDLITLRSSSEVFNPDRTTAVKQEVARVDAVPNATTILLQTRTWNTYSISGPTVTIQRIPPMRGLLVKDLTVAGAADASAQTGLQLSYFDGLRIQDVTIEGVGGEGLALVAGVDGKVAGSRVTGSLAVSTGYGFHAVQVQTVKFVDCYGRGNRHSFDVDEARDVLYQGCTAENDSSAGISSHGSTDTVKFIANTVIDCGGGIVARGQNTQIVDNDIVGSKNLVESDASYCHGINLGDDGSNPWGQGLAGTGLIVRGNRIRMAGADWSGATKAVGVYCTAPLVGAVIEGNTLAGFSSHGIYAKGDYNLQVVIRDNTLDCRNQVGTAGTTVSHGVVVAPAHGATGNNSKDIQVSGNRVISPLMAGVRVTGNVDAVSVSEDLEITGNHITGIAVTGQSGVDVSTGYFGDRVRVRDNRLTGSPSDAAAVRRGGAGQYATAVQVNGNAS